MQETSNAQLEDQFNAAMLYLEAGISIIPFPYKGKLPDDEALKAVGSVSSNGMASWKTYQNRLATREEAETWFSNTPRNLGIATGFNDVFGLDFDYDERYETWAASCPIWAKKLPTLKTTLGYHVLFRTNKASSTKYRILLPAYMVSDPDYPELASFMGKGGCMTSWPSIHASGKQYRWLEGRAPWEIGLPEIDRLADINIRIERKSPRIFAWMLRCFTNPMLAKEHLQYYLLRRRGEETTENRYVNS